MQSRMTNQLLVRSLSIIPGTEVWDEALHAFSESELNQFFSDCIPGPITLKSIKENNLIGEFNKPAARKKLFHYCDKTSTRLKPVNITFSHYDETQKKVVFKSRTRYGVPELDLRKLDILLTPENVKAIRNPSMCGLTSMDVLPVCEFLLENPIVLLKDLSNPKLPVTDRVARIYRKLCLQLNHLRQSGSDLDEWLDSESSSELTPQQRSAAQMRQAEIRREQMKPLSRSSMFSQPNTDRKNSTARLPRLSLPARINSFRKN